MKRTHLILFVLIFSLSASQVCGQEAINLASELEGGQMEVLNRSISALQGIPGAVELNAASGDGMAILQDIEWTKGNLEVQLLGENAPGRSFIGIAFNIADGNTYEAVYFRPFNFVAEAQGNRDHMVQYICHPQYTWNRLRDERTGEFEAELPVPPDPEGWFRVRIHVTEEKVMVYVNDDPEPVLEVPRLTEGVSGRIGLWTGNGSSGRYRNLIIGSEDQ